MAEICFSYNKAAQKLRKNQIKIKVCVAGYIIIEFITMLYEVGRIYLVNNKFVNSVFVILIILVLRICRMVIHFVCGRFYIKNYNKLLDMFYNK